MLSRSAMHRTNPTISSMTRLRSLASLATHHSRACIQNIPFVRDRCPTEVLAQKTPPLPNLRELARLPIATERLTEVQAGVTFWPFRWIPKSRRKMSGISILS